MSTSSLHSTASVGVRAFGLLAVFALAGCSDAHLTFLDPQGPVAAAQRHQFWLVIAVTSTVVLPVLVLTPWILVRYRYGRQAAYRPQWGFSKLADLVIWGVPVLVVIVLAITAWRSTLALDPYKPLTSDTPPLEVQVIGFDWKWLFVYPEQGIASVNRLVIPAGRPVSFELTSASVMQGFFIPALGSQIDVMNRMTTKLHLQADETGTFIGKNMQYNGTGFHQQRFVTQAVAPAAFQRFVDRTRQDGVPLDADAYRALDERGTAARLRQRLAPETAVAERGEIATLAFSALPAGFFDAVVAHESPNWNARDGEDGPPETGTDQDEPTNRDERRHERRNTQAATTGSRQS
ncbi:cytochrome c oxidase subunit II [Salinicola halophilus]|uniref:cytochrome c oxidase subunit II n=1 Tax=Salinicola halophilus TaxID=184065 RepID=UPI0013A6100F|nr:ubiquinol oxidase subunit II [Salinicola halophilus]